MVGNIGPPPRDLQPFRTPTRTPRLLLRRSDSSSGQFGGAWWPWTANLTAELHDLISVPNKRMRWASRTERPNQLGIRSENQ
ncbi:DUF5994 family protein [Nocardia anaemiae]|uniref:DUF5994 family protein n=1 Tax=Nocardia anaemiae TaxID=263910 RepID=UPI000A466114|nr:DUF5994 family protein [Nocardia anaemiae]